jgi:hypothetical protein
MYVHTSFHRVSMVLSFSPVVGIDTPPTPYPQRVCPPPPCGSGGRGTLASEKGGGRVPIPTREHTLWYSVNICTSTLCFLPSCWQVCHCLELIN